MFRGVHLRLPSVLFWALLQVEGPWDSPETPNLRPRSKWALRDLDPDNLVGFFSESLFALQQLRDHLISQTFRCRHGGSRRGCCSSWMPLWRGVPGISHWAEAPGKTLESGNPFGSPEELEEVGGEKKGDAPLNYWSHDNRRGKFYFFFLFFFNFFFYFILPM